MNAICNECGREHRAGYDCPWWQVLEKQVLRGPDELEAQWTAVALLWGRPPIAWILLKSYGVRDHSTIPLTFRMALQKVFHPEEVKRVGLVRFAYDYAVWYHGANMRKAGWMPHENHP